MQITEIEKEIGAVIVGMGAHGTEMLKTLTWFCQMDGYRVTLNAFDKDELAESKFTALCPELMDEKFNGKYIEKEAQYLINIHSGIDVDSLEFTEKIKKLPNTTYVFVAIGGDSDNIRCAVNLRTLFVRMGIHPIIHAVVYDSDKKEALVGVENFKKQAYDIDFVGDLKSIYSEEVIINSELEHIALRGHMKRAEDKIRDDEAAAKKKSTPEDFAEKLLEAKNELFTFEYNYRSSIASALHIKARRACEIPGTDKKIDDMSEAEKEGIKILEHRRWNAYMRSEGFIFSGSTESDTRNDLGKMHNDLTDFDKLNAKEKEKDLRV